MPEVQRSFYTTGKVGIDYFHYVADELPAICGKWFHLDQRRENTFIAGESMGGYGAVKIALNRPGRYEAVASLSGVLDYVGFTEMVLATASYRPGLFNAIFTATYPPILSPAINVFSRL